MPNLSTALSRTMRGDLIESTERGLFCSAGDFYIDPWQPVRQALITHAHGDHARPGCERYLCVEECEPFIKLRLGAEAITQTLQYGEELYLNGVKVSFHPAGHITGAAQIRVEHRGEVWVVSGDYKRQEDPTCAPFEVVPCDTFITESTFGLPIYRWADTHLIAREINEWWAKNKEEGITSIIFGYSLGKAQRVLALLNSEIGPITAHGAVSRMCSGYEALGISLPSLLPFSDSKLRGSAMVIAPPSAANTPWLKRFSPYATAFASGWMQIRGIRRRRAADRGFVLSDHADWPALLRTIQETGAGRVLVTHGYTAQLVRWLNEQGIESQSIKTEYEGELEQSATQHDTVQPAVPES